VRPIIGAQFVGSGLECSDVVNREEGIVVLAEADLLTIELLLDEVVAVEVICRLEGEEGSDTPGSSMRGSLTTW
jgi:hypothetical protein